MLLGHRRPRRPSHIGFRDQEVVLWVLSGGVDIGGLGNDDRDTPGELARILASCADLDLLHRSRAFRLQIQHTSPPRNAPATCGVHSTGASPLASSPVPPPLWAFPARRAPHRKACQLSTTGPLGPARLVPHHPGPQETWQRSVVSPACLRTPLRPSDDPQHFRYLAQPLLSRRATSLCPAPPCPKPGTPRTP